MMKEMWQGMQERAEIAGIVVLVGILVVACCTIIYGCWGLRAARKAREGDKMRITPDGVDTFLHCGCYICRDASGKAKNKNYCDNHLPPMPEPESTESPAVEVPLEVHSDSLCLQCWGATAKQITLSSANNWGRCKWRYHSDAVRDILHSEAMDNELDECSTCGTVTVDIMSKEVLDGNMWAYWCPECGEIEKKFWKSSTCVHIETKQPKNRRLER